MRRFGSALRRNATDLQEKVPAMQDKPNMDIDAQGELLLEELLDLRREVAQVLGRDQYAYRVIDDAVESQHAPTMAQALRAIEHCEDLRSHLAASEKQPTKIARK